MKAMTGTKMAAMSDARKPVMKGPHERSADGGQEGHTDTLEIVSKHKLAEPVDRTMDRMILNFHTVQTSHTEVRRAERKHIIH